MRRLGILPDRADHPLTLTFAVGGAGAQREIGLEILESLAGQVKEGRIRLILVAGIKSKTKDYFQAAVWALGLETELDRGVKILFALTMAEYFDGFNLALRQTDILWTKPSELSFYAALGLPLIIAPTIGSHEEFNQRWLLKSDFGLLQKDPRFCSEWLFDLVSQGHLAEKAFEGFLEGERQGTQRIAEIVFKKAL